MRGVHTLPRTAPKSLAVLRSIEPPQLLRLCGLVGGQRALDRWPVWRTRWHRLVPPLAPRLPAHLHSYVLLSARPPLCTRQVRRGRLAADVGAGGDPPAPRILGRPCHLAVSSALESRSGAPPAIITESAAMITEAAAMITEAPAIITASAAMITEAAAIITESAAMITELAAGAAPLSAGGRLGVWRWSGAWEGSARP